MTDTTADEVGAALESVRQLVSSDGGDVQLVSFDPATSTANLRLVLETAGCHDCVMPRPMLEEVATTVLRRRLPALETVVIDDPREHPGYTPPT